MNDDKTLKQWQENRECGCTFYCRTVKPKHSTQLVTMKLSTSRCVEHEIPNSASYPDLITPEVLQ